MNHTSFCLLPSLSPIPACMLTCLHSSLFLPPVYQLAMEAVFILLVTPCQCISPVCSPIFISLCLSSCLTEFVYLPLSPYLSPCNLNWLCFSLRTRLTSGLIWATYRRAAGTHNVTYMHVHANKKYTTSNSVFCCPSSLAPTINYPLVRTGDICVQDAKSKLIYFICAKRCNYAGDDGELLFSYF